MKELKTLSLVFFSLFAGFLLRHLTGWPLPAVVWAMLIFYLFLASKILPLSEAEPSSQLFLKHMGLFFIPISVGLVEVYPQMAHAIGPIILILTISTLLTYVVTSLVVHFFIKREEDHGD